MVFPCVSQKEGNLPTINLQVRAVSFRECVILTYFDILSLAKLLFCIMLIYFVRWPLMKKVTLLELHTVYLLLAMGACLWGWRCRLSGWSLPQLRRTQGVSLAVEWQLKSELKVLGACPKGKASWYVWCIWSMKPFILLISSDSIFPGAFPNGRSVLWFFCNYKKCQKWANLVYDLDISTSMS